VEERWFDVAGDGGVRLRARQIAGASNDAPAILLHHGLASSQRIWDLMVPDSPGGSASSPTTRAATGFRRSPRPDTGSITSPAMPWR